MILISVYWLKVLLYTSVKKRFWIIEVIGQLTALGKFYCFLTHPERSEVRTSTFPWIDQQSCDHHRTTNEDHFPSLSPNKPWSGNPTSRFTWNFNLQVACSVTSTYRITVAYWPPTRPSGQKKKCASVNNRCIRSKISGGDLDCRIVTLAGSRWASNYYNIYQPLRSGRIWH